MLKLIRRAFESQKIRFLFVGGLNTIFGYLCYALLLFIGLHYFMAQFVGSFFAIAHSYLWNKYFTFKSTEKRPAEVLRFILVYVVGYGVTAAILFLSIDVLEMNPYVGGFTALAVTTVISYIGHRSFSFRKAQFNDK